MNQSAKRAMSRSIWTALSVGGKSRKRRLGNETVIRARKLNKNSWVLCGGSGGRYLGGCEGRGGGGEGGRAEEWAERRERSGSGGGREKGGGSRLFTESGGAMLLEIDDGQQDTP